MSAQKLEDFFNEMIKLDPEHDNVDSGLPGPSGSPQPSGSSQPYGSSGPTGYARAPLAAGSAGASTFDGNDPNLQAIRGQLPPELMEKKKRKLLQKYKEKRQHKRHLPYRGLRCSMGQIHDMSISGIRLETVVEKTYQPTQKLELKFAFEDDQMKRDYIIQGEIMWVTITWDERQHLGVKFNTMADVFQLPIPILKHLGVPEEKLAPDYLQGVRTKLNKYKHGSRTNSWLKVMEGLCPEDED